MQLTHFFKQHINLSSEMEAVLETAFKTETLPKGHKLLMPDNLSKKIFFFETGFARTFYYKEDKDITHYFYGENAFSAPIESIFYNTPSPYGLELLEASTIRSCTYDKVEEFLSQSPEIEKFVRLLLVNLLHDFSNRLYAIQFQTATERYQTMLKTNPDILLKAPLGHIASYLGITQQTLSVIRAQKL